MTRLVSVNEEREKYQRQRDEAWQQQLSSVMHFQVTHPTDPGAHPDLRELATEISRQLTDIRKMLTNHDNWISDYTAEQQGRSEILGLQYKGLFFGLSAAGTLTAVLAATGVL